MNGSPVRRSAALAALVTFAGAAPAQSDGAVRALATGDAVAVETARRQLVAGAAADVPVAVLTQVLRSADPARRRAAAGVLLFHGLVPDAVAAWLDTERDASVLEPLVELLPVAALARLADDEALRRELAADEADLWADLAGRLRARALGRLLDAGLVDVDRWRRALGSADRRFARAAARLLADEAWPLPRELFDGDTPADVRGVLLEALADRPRPEGRALVAWRDDAALDPTERLLATLATPVDTWDRATIRRLLESLDAEDPDVRGLAIRGCALLPTEQAERLVADVHRRGMEGAPLDDLLRALARIGPRGERHLVGLARELGEGQRAAIVEWLAARSSPVLPEIVADALDGRYPLTADLLLRSGALLDGPARVARVTAILVDAEQDGGLRVAAFAALVDRGVLEDGMLEFALDPDGDPRARVRQLVSIPADAIGADAWGRILDAAPHAVLQEVLGRMADAPVAVGLEDRLAALAATGVGISDLAAHVCLVAGRAALAERVWGALTDDRRLDLATSIRRRGAEGWVLPALRELASRRSGDALRFARIVAGDQDVLRALLADPASWTATWLRRVQDEARAALTTDDVAAVQRGCARAELGAASRRELVRWIAERPDLGAGDWLAQVARDDEDEEVRYAATRGMLRRDAIAGRIRAELSAAMAGGLDGDGRELAFEALGALEPPLSAEGCAFAARFAIVAPLAHPRHEIEAALRLEPVADVALLNAVWQVAGRVAAPGFGAALEAAVVEAAAHPNAALAARQRLGRFLALLAREESTRRQSVPVARALLAAPDLDPVFVGPALVVLAEDAEARGAWGEAGALWARAARACLRTPPEPLVLRTFVGDTWLAEGSLPAAFLVARPLVCAARAALAAGDAAATAEALAHARTIGAGDRATMAEIEQLEQETRR